MNNNIDFDDLDYSRMMCNVMSIAPGKNPEFEFDIFLKYKEFEKQIKELDRKKLFRYFPLVYDKNSPLHEVISDIKKIKGKAAELAGFQKDENGEFLKPVMRMMNCEEDEVNAMIIRYVLLHKSAKYHQMVVLREAHAKLSADVLIDPKKYVDSFNNVGEKLDTVHQELLSGDNNAHLQDSLDEYYFENELRLRPEDIAKRIREGVTAV